jgi:tetratricopeptide (TPR) repeat protein
VLICLGLALAVLAAYAPLWGCGFVNYDDYDYVVENGMVQHGLNAKSLAWAFTTTHCSNWHPLTWISHILDFQLYGEDAAGHHLTSLLLHLANSVLLFLLLRRLTKAMWPSALASALFALHPMHVESVAWISERKDVLSTLFWMLAVWMYVRYVEKQKASSFAKTSAFAGPTVDTSEDRESGKRKLYYALALVFFILGLMAKPMLVTLPFVLLLLDYWPLERDRRRAVRWVAEKIPFFALAAASCVVTCVAQQQQGGRLASLSDLSLVERFKGIPIAYVRYVGKTLWPVHLAALYPVPPHWPAWEAAGAVCFLALVTGWVFARRKAQPCLAVGWLWFLGTLVPVIGLVQAGAQSMADRYSYVPSIGLAIMIIWGAREWTPRLGGAAPAVLGCLAVSACLVLTPLQTSYWRNTETLYRRALATTKDNGIMEGCLGKLLLKEGRVDEALPHLQRGVACNNEQEGVHGALGQALLAKGRGAEALEQFQIDVKLRPENAAAQFNLGSLLLEKGLAVQAVPYLQKALQINPAAPEYDYKLGNALLQAGRAREAVAAYDEALRLRPDYMEANANLAWILASHPDPSLRDGDRAVALASRADQLAGGRNPVSLGTLAVAYAAVGKFPEAVATARRALQLLGTETNSPMAVTLRAQIALYQSGQPFRDTVPARPAPPPPSH